MTLTRPVLGNPTFMGQGPRRVHFGFPADAAVDVVVRWGDGTPETVLPGVASGQLVRVKRGDLEGDGVVGFSDLLRLLLSWGDCPATPCAGDLDGNGEVDRADLLILILAWG